MTRGDKTKAFTFTAEITVSGLAEGEEFTYGWMDEANNQHFEKKAAGGSGTDTASISDVSLKDGEDVTLVVPKGAKVVITETAVTGYKITNQIDSGTATESNVATIAEAVDGTEVHFTNELELTEQTETKEITRTITYTEETAEGPEVAPTKTQTAYLKKTYYVDAAGNTYDEEGSPIDLNETPWVLNPDKTSDVSAVNSPDHPKKEEEEWNPDRTKVDEWLIDFNNPESTEVNVIYTKDTYTDSEETKTITRTITYTERTPDGKEVAKAKVQSVTIKRSVRTNDRTGESTYGNWEIESGDTSAVISPVVDGWETEDTTVPAQVKLIDPKTGEPTDATEVAVYDKDGNKLGTYKLNTTGKTNADGSVGYEIKFTPEGDYVGTPPAITLRAYDENGLYADGVYQPEVVGSTPEPEKKNVSPAEPEKKGTSPAAAKTKGATKVKTGDENNPALWLLLSVCSLLLVIAFARTRRYRR